MRLTPKLFCLGLLIAAGAPLTAGEAVSQLNGKLGYSYGDYDSDEGQSVAGSVSFPLSTQFGAQLDGGYSRIAGSDFYGVGGHLFWRDWDRGLVGLAFAGTDSEFVRTRESGIEAEYYLKYVTAGVYAGISNITYDFAAPFIDTDKTAAFGTLYLGVYPVPDLMLRPSYTRKLGINYARLEIEYALPRRNLAVTLDGIIGEHDFTQAQLGLRYYFGGKKNLKARHRQDDPADLTAGSLTSVGLYGAKFIQQADAYIRGLQSAAAANPGSTQGGTPPANGSSTVDNGSTQGGSVIVGGSDPTLGGIPTLGGSSSFSGGSIVSTSTGMIVPGSANTITNGTLILSGGSFTGGGDLPTVTP